MKKIVIHAGFHKTATTTVQNFFKQNAAAFKGKYFIPARSNFDVVNRTARSFAADPKSALKRVEFFDAFNAYLGERIERAEDVFLLSSETFSGHIPGRPNVQDYGAAIRLLAAIEFSVRDVFGIEDLTFYYSTRAADQWLPSAYSEHVKASRMVLSEEEFIEKYRESANFDRIIEALREALASPVIAKNIESLDHEPFGPVQPLLDLIEFPEAKRGDLVLTPVRNRRLPMDIQNQLLEINRSDLSYEEVIKAKRAIIDEYRNGKPL